MGDSRSSVGRRSTGKPPRLPHPSSALVLLITLLCCGLPVAWVLWTIAANPGALAELAGDRYRWMLLARTVGYNAAAAVVACALAWPVALVMGRGRGAIATLFWAALPASLLVPSIVYAYGWSQFVWLTRDAWPSGWFVAGTSTDVARCVWSLGAWLWPVPAGAVALALRRADGDLQQQAVLDGATRRFTMRQVAPAGGAAFAVVMVLAMQEFSVYEPTNVSVIATEVRAVFETGGVMVGDATNSTASPSASPNAAAFQSRGFATPSQPARAAAAVVTGAPLVLIVALLGATALLALGGAARGRSASGEVVDVATVPARLRPTWRSTAAAAGVLAVTLGVPVGSLALSHSGGRSLGFVLAEYRPQVVGSLLTAGATAALAGAVALLACVRPSRATLVLAAASFLIGGQFVAIALVRAYNRPWLNWAYDGMPVMVAAYLARFAWLPLLAARGTLSPRHRALRDMAAVDGATPWRATVHAVWPVAWPTLLASALLVGALALGEVPATTLLSPLRPPMLVPSLMTWVHQLRSDPMIEASLLLASVALGLGAVVSALVWLGGRRRGWKMENGGWRTNNRLRLSILHPLSSLLVFASLSCDSPSAPDAVWLGTGVGPAQVVYPRGIAHAPASDSFFVVDRMARVQHVDASGQFVNDWFMPESRIGKPTGLSVGPDGNVYVADTHYHRVVVYSPTGTQLRQWGTNGTGDGQFVWPTDVAFDARGRVFVSEYGDNDRIQAFDANGAFLFKFGRFGQGEGEFSRPQSMAIDGDTLYVADACNHRIAVFTTDGRFVRNMGGVGSELGQFRFPYGLVADGKGGLVVTEFGNNRVQWVDARTGRGLKTWGAAGREPGQLAYPWAAAVDNRGRVVIVDAGNNRLQVLKD